MFKKAHGKGIALVILGIVAVIGLVMLFKGGNITGAFSVGECIQKICREQVCAPLSGQAFLECMRTCEDFCRKQAAPVSEQGVQASAMGTSQSALRTQSNTENRNAAFNRVCVPDGQTTNCFLTVGEAVAQCCSGQISFTEPCLGGLVRVNCGI